MNDKVLLGFGGFIIYIYLNYKIRFVNIDGLMEKFKKVIIKYYMGNGGWIGFVFEKINVKMKEERLIFVRVWGFVGKVEKRYLSFYCYGVYYLSYFVSYLLYYLLCNCDFIYLKMDYFKYYFKIDYTINIKDIIKKMRHNSETENDNIKSKN